MSFLEIQSDSLIELERLEHELGRLEYSSSEIKKNNNNNLFNIVKKS